MTRTFNHRRWLLLTLVCAFAIACGGGETKTEKPLGGGSGDPNPTAKPRSDAFGKRVTVFMKATINILEENKADCSELGQKLSAHLDENEDLLKKMAKTGSTIDAKTWKDDNQELVRQFNGSYQVLLKKCKNNEHVKEYRKKEAALEAGE